MLDWLKKIAGGKPFTNKVGLKSDALALLAEDFGRLEKIHSELPNQVLQYVLDDTNREVVEQLSQTKEAAELLELEGSARYGIDRVDNPRGQFFKCVQCSDPQFFLRLGKIYEAAEKAHVGARLPHFQRQSCFKEPGLGWLELLLMEAWELNPNIWPRRFRACQALTAEIVEAMMQSEGHAPELLVRAAFRSNVQAYVENQFDPIFRKMEGMARSAVRHKQTLLGILDDPDFKQRVYAVDMMKRCKVPVAEFLDKLFALTIDSSKQVREAADGILTEDKAAALPLVQRKVTEGDNDERASAVRLLWRWEGEKARAFLAARVEQEQSKKVAQLIQDLISVSRIEPPVKQADALALPPLPPIPEHLPLGPETEHAWQQCFTKINAAIAAMLAGPHGNYYRNLNSVTVDVINQSFAMLQGKTTTKPVLTGFIYCASDKAFKEALSEFWQRPELQATHLVRFFLLVGSLRFGEHDRGVLSYGSWLETLLPGFRRAHPEFDLRGLGAAFKGAGLESRRLGAGLLGSYNEQVAALGFQPPQIWPYWVEHTDVLKNALESPTGDYMSRWQRRYSRRNAFHALATFPVPPPVLVPQLWDLALGPKTERAAAQRCLKGLPDKGERLIESLKGGSAESRAAAADWLSDIRDASAIAPLKAALKKEKNESTKGAIMGALELLGVPVEQFLDREGLSKEASKGIAKGIPEDVKWFPFAQLPVVHWEDNGKAVDPLILQWWLVQGFKLKDPEPGALLRKYCASFKATEREALGQFVLDAWLARDTSPRTGTDAEKEAMRRAHAAVQAAQHWAQWIQQNPQMASQMAAYAPKQKTLQEHYEEILPVVLREPTGTAISSKGILSLAGACVGSGAAPLVGRYLKDWYGMRAAQCRALLQMLAWVEHKTATQMLLAVGRRFRTKGIQEEANKQAQALAERKGWTVAELSDRTIPTAGLDDDGVMTLDFGGRQFTAKLNEDLEFVLTDSDGKVLKSLPDARKDDDEAKAAEVKKMFSAAKKELKSVVTMQRDRLYEAMCTQRSWPFEDWSAYLNRHPVVRHHCQRLIWAVIRDDKITALFRPLPDGSLTDVEDNPVTLKPDELVRVAHECQVTPEQSLAWRQHLKDYDVEPLFEQFGRPNFDLPEERKQDDELTDFRGHMLETFKLRGRATKLGYSRGQAEDGGWFYTYHKRFPTLGMQAIIEFTGNGLPEENRQIALTMLRFERVAPEGEAGAGGKMSLGEVPAVLLTECWNDIRQIAAEGPGFDADWEKKGYP